MKTAIFLVTAIAALGTIGITTAITSSAMPALGQGVNNGNSPCTDRGLHFSGCLPGQHANTQNTQGKPSNAIVGNPHYPQISGPTTGNPHGATACNAETGNPHSLGPSSTNPTCR